MPKETENRYIEGIGRRKTSIARVRITPSPKASIVVNDKTLEEYFPTRELQNEAMKPLKDAKIDQKFIIPVKVRGGGISSQSGAVKLGLSRALISYDVTLRKVQKKAGNLKRNPRVKERRKFGLKKARKAPQWSKR